MGQIKDGIKGPFQLHVRDNESDSSTDTDSDDSLADVSDPDMQARLAHLQRRIQAEAKKQVKHRAVRPPRIGNPFDGYPIRQQLFERILQEKKAALYIPPDFDFFPWNEVDAIKVGKEMVEVTLPQAVWIPRAIEWVRGLEILGTVRLHFE